MPTMAILSEFIVYVRECHCISVLFLYYIYRVYNEDFNNQGNFPEKGNEC